MSGHKNNRKLKNYLFVNKVQVTIGMGNLLLLLMMFGVVIFTVLSPLYSDIFQPEDAGFRILSSKIFLLLLERCAIAFCFLLFIVLLYQIFIVHRICGPMLNFERTLDKLHSGDLSRKVILRRHDYFKTEAVKLNESLEVVSNIVAVIRDCNLEIQTQINNAKNTGLHDEEMVDIISKISGQTHKSKKELSRLTIIETTGSNP